MSEKKSETKSTKKKQKKLALSQQNTKLKAEVELYKDKWLRAAAEFENFRRRNAKEKIEWIRIANQTLLLEIVEVFEHLELAIKSANEKDSPKNFKKGIEIIHKQMKQIFEKEGLKKIETVGQKFDPNFHEAIIFTEHKKYDENIIFDNIRNGYLLNDKILRHARVAVSKGKKKTKKAIKENKNG
ncbi:MAG: nucleotide exchange factor GrpE [Candidatus Cloacimonetes bacterium]|nr:nucleotide exchange factor GrpE [Candidatus Cloacimonadota bacterium]MBL7108200.1 nucleotide exchange factor GrpE [Candidatus Cloacimonadota bacterium]